MTFTILIATYNRSHVLFSTLRRLTQLDMFGLSVEIVVIDNNSSDNTRSVVETFLPELSLVYLFEPCAGKNHALNHALENVLLGDVVVFTDDDVTPNRDWLQQIAMACRQFSDYSVFGGHIYPIWPNEINIPSWVDDPFIRGVFTFHSIGDGVLPTPYPTNSFPCGANLWFRKNIFDKGYRFDPNIGPSPKKRIMGSETSFLKQLRDAGYPMLHVPASAVGHRIKPEEICFSHVKKRLKLSGKSAPYAIGIQPAELFSSHPWFWRLRCLLSFAKWFLYGMFFWIPSGNKSWRGHLGLAYHKLHLNWSSLRRSFE